MTIGPRTPGRSPVAPVAQSGFVRPPAPWDDRDHLGRDLYDRQIEADLADLDYLDELGRYP